MSNNSTPNFEIGRLVEKLRSPNTLERVQAKRQIYESGSEAIAPLLDLLVDLAINRHPRFQIGEEEKGEAIVATYYAVRQQEGYRSDKLPSMKKKIDALAINDRLATDLLILLGELKAEAAIPFLINIIESDAIYGSTGGYAISEEKMALKAIGESAIPYLIKTIKEAESRVRTEAIEFISFRYRFSYEPLDMKPDDSIDIPVTALSLIFERESSENDIQWDKNHIQISALLVLRMMKAYKAIPDLEVIMNETKDEHLISFIKEAITRIKSLPVIGGWILAKR